MHKVTIPTRGFPTYAFVSEWVMVAFWFCCVVFTIILHTCWKKGLVKW